MDTPGYAVVSSINDALQAWAGHHMRTVKYLSKGSSSLTDTHSALRADVELPMDISTQYNTGFIERIENSERVRD